MTINWQFRPNTQDEDIYREVYVENCYRLPDDMSGITVIDVGANIGCFTVACLERGADWVFAFEPDPGNYEQLKTHVSEFKNASTYNAFVSKFAGFAMVSEYQESNGVKFTGGVSIFAKEGQKVESISALEAFSNVVGKTWLKLDCEGAEYQILSSDLPWGRIERIFGECHDYRDGKFSRDTDPVEVGSDAFGGLDPNIISIVGLLFSRGYDVQQEKNPEDPHLTLFFASRKEKCSQCGDELFSWSDGLGLRCRNGHFPMHEISDAMNDQNLRDRLQEDKEKELKRLDESLNPGFISGVGFTNSPSIVGSAKPFAKFAEICSICGKPALCVSGNVDALVCSECFSLTNGKSVVVLTPFRNARRYLRLYFSQISDLKHALESEGYSLRLVAAEGDSLDNTRERIIELSGLYNIPLEIVDTTHGHMRWGSVEDPIRMKVMSDVMNKALERVTENDDIVVWIMSDLKWNVSEILGMIDTIKEDSTEYSVLAPLVFIDDQEQIFYDTWAYRAEGIRFQNTFPYHPKLKKGRYLFELDSAGSCLVMKGSIARSFKSGNQEAVSFCQNVKSGGNRIALGTGWVISHAPQSSARILWIGDAVCVSGFARVSHNLFPILSEAGYEIDIIATNYQGTPHNYPYRIWPAGEDSGTYRAQQLVYYAEKQNAQYDAIVVLDDPWNVQRITLALKDLKENGNLEFIPPVIAWITVDGCNNKSIGNGFAHIVASTKFGADEILRACLEDEFTSDVSVIPFGVDISIYHPLDKIESRRLVSSKDVPEDAFIVGTVSTNQLRKRLDLLLKYFAEWNNRSAVENAYLYLCLGAENSTGCDVLSLIRYYGLRKKVILNTSLLNEQTMAHVYNSFDVFVSLSQGEGFGLTALEAMACGVPTILSNWSGYGSWVPDDCAIKIPCSSTALSSPLNSQAYVIGGVADGGQTVNALHRLYAFPDMRETLREKGLNLAKSLSWKSSGDTLLDVLDKVIAQKNIDSMKKSI